MSQFDIRNQIIAAVARFVGTPFDATEPNVNAIENAILDVNGVFSVAVHVAETLTVVTHANAVAELAEDAFVTVELAPWPQVVADPASLEFDKVAEIQGEIDELRGRLGRVEAATSKLLGWQAHADELFACLRNAVADHPAA